MIWPHVFSPDPCAPRFCTQCRRRATQHEVLARPVGWPGALVPVSEDALRRLLASGEVIEVRRFT